MALTKEEKISQIEIVGDYKFVQIRTTVTVKEDDKKISSSYHRRSLTPDADISSETSEIQGICNSVWTDDVKSAYEDFKTEKGLE